MSVAEARGAAVDVEAGEGGEALLPVVVAGKAALLLPPVQLGVEAVVPLTRTVWTRALGVVARAHQFGVVLGQGFGRAHTHTHALMYRVVGQLHKRR